MSLTVSTRVLGLSRPAVITGRKIRFAVVGCGRISRNHFDALQVHSNDAELVGMCDTDADRLAAVRAKYNVPAFSSLRELLGGCPADAIVLASPSGLHSRRPSRPLKMGAT